MDDRKRLKVYCETSFWSYLNGHLAPFACAEYAGCDWFLTTDDGILKKAKGKVGVRVGSPVEYIMENHDENV